MRVLHLIDQASPQASGATLQLLSEPLGRMGRVDQRVLLLGGEALRREARDVGIRKPICLSVPLGQALPGLFAIQRRLRSLGAVDLVHCWSIGALSAAALLLRRVPKILTLTQTPSPRAVKWLRILTSESGGLITILPTSSTIHRALLEGGVEPLGSHVLRPGIDLSKVVLNQKAALRRRWGLHDESQKVVALVSDPPHAADAVEAFLAVLLADGSRVAQEMTLDLLVHPDQTHRLRADRLGRHLHRSRWVIQEPCLAQPWRCLGACDVALAIGPHAGSLSLLWAMSANVPIVGEAHYAISEIVEDRHSALLAKPGAAKSLAHRLSQVLGDSQLAWKLRDTARHEAYSFFSRQRYVQSLMSVYEQLVAGCRELEIPALQSTGGLRFAGRG